SSQSHVSYFARLLNPQAAIPKRSCCAERVALGLMEAPILERMEPMGRRSRYPQELRERAVRMVQEHRDEYPSEWAAITSIAGKLGVGTEALRLWLRRAQVDQGQRAGLTSQERERLKQL